MAIHSLVINATFGDQRLATLTLKAKA